MSAKITARVGDFGDNQVFDTLETAIDYLNEMRVGAVHNWVCGGFETCNYHGGDYVSLFWSDDLGHLADLDKIDRETVEQSLEEHYL